MQHLYISTHKKYILITVIYLGTFSIRNYILINPNMKSSIMYQNYNCTNCNYMTCRKSQYNRHILTEKHKLHLQPNETSSKMVMYTCSCGKKYKHMSSLCSHKNRCSYTNITTPLQNAPDTTQIVGIMETLIKENQEFKKLMIEQNSQIMEIAKNSQVINNTTTNQKFNLNFFLNDTCKDAMSITDFLRNMNVHIDELEYIGNHGYVNGMTKMIMDRLKGMDITKRPIHCTDIKRETMYIKDDTGWSKDTDELTKLRKILGRISMNNYRAVPDWRTAHPDCEVMDTRNYEFCYKMMRAILGDVEDEQIKLDNKIIKTMAKELFVKK